MATIRPNALPAAASVPDTSAIIIDTGSAVEKATPAQIVDTASPLASQADAEAGADNTKRMSPLRVKQAIAALGVTSEALAAITPGNGVMNFAGYAGDDSAEMTAALAAAFDNAYKGGAIEVGKRELTLSGSYDWVRETSIDFKMAKVDWTPSGDAAINIGWGTTGTGNTIAKPLIRGGLINLYGVGKTFIRIQNSSDFQWFDTDLYMRDNDQVGLHIKGSVDPFAPYYGNIGNLRLSGAAGKTGQVGIKIEGIPSDSSAGGNRWRFSNIRHVATLAIGFDIQDAEGLTFNTVSFEGITQDVVRLGYGARTHAGSVTTVGAYSSGFIDSSLVGLTLARTGTIMVTSGPNSGQSIRVVDMNPATGEISLPYGMPEQFVVGNTYTYTETTANTVVGRALDYEGGAAAEVLFNFKAGAGGCVMQADFYTDDSASYIFRREVEDLSNRVGFPVTTLVFTGTIATGDSTQQLNGSTISTQGGFLVPYGECWIDAVRVTGESRSAAGGNAGTIEVQPYVAGAAVAGMIAKLTQASPERAQKVRKDMTPNDFLRMGDNIEVIATGTGVTVIDPIRVEIDIRSMK